VSTIGAVAPVPSRLAEIDPQSILADEVASRPGAAVRIGFRDWQMV
jgi:hypothetical protein